MWPMSREGWRWLLVLRLRNSPTALGPAGHGPQESVERALPLAHGVGVHRSIPLHSEAAARRTTRDQDGRGHDDPDPREPDRGDRGCPRQSQTEANGPGDPGPLAAEIELRKCKTMRRILPIHKDRQPEIYMEIWKDFLPRLAIQARVLN